MLPSYTPSFNFLGLGGSGGSGGLGGLFGALGGSQGGAALNPGAGGGDVSAGTPGTGFNTEGPFGGGMIGDPQGAHFSYSPGSVGFGYGRGSVNLGVTGVGPSYDFANLMGVDPNLNGVMNSAAKQGINAATGYPTNYSFPGMGPASMIGAFTSAMKGIDALAQALGYQTTSQMLGKMGISGLGAVGGEFGSQEFANLAYALAMNGQFPGYSVPGFQGRTGIGIDDPNNDDPEGTAAAAAAAAAQAQAEADAASESEGGGGGSGPGPSGGGGPSGATGDGPY